jgi:serine/threonine protein kinase
MARLNQANIVTIHDFGQAADPDAANDQPMYYLVMEYVDGTNLRSMLRQRRLEPGEAMEIVRSLCDALQYAHEEGIVHRDIKPENILIDKKGRVKIADFGLAKLVGRTPRDITLTDSHHALGTLHYMAPEQLERPLEVDHRADIYALGVTFYEMLTGELPIGRFAPPSRKAHIDVRLDEVVLRTLEREPERRYQHASDVKTAVQSCGAGPLRKPGDVPDTTVETSSALAPGTAPRLLMVTLGSIASLSMAIGGVGLLIYSTAIYATAGPERWSWFFGGGIGFSIGGIAGS